MIPTINKRVCNQGLPKQSASAARGEVNGTAGRVKINVVGVGIIGSGAASLIHQNGHVVGDGNTAGDGEFKPAHDCERAIRRSTPETTCAVCYFHSCIVCESDSARRICKETET